MTLKNFDFISPKITFYYKNKKRHISPFGGLLSIIGFILSLYIIINYTIFKDFTNKSSLLMNRNFEIDKSYNYFNETGLFHFIWIYKNNNIFNNNEIQLNNIKNSLIRIYMTYSFDKYEYNSSNLEDNDHWVYDTCHTYINKEDKIYDYSFSSCIKYYYNSLEKKYYSIHDELNFKWPFMRENISNHENAFYATFVEKCTNNSKMKDIFGDCYPEEKIDEYLSNFQNIFISFINNKIQIKDSKSHIQKYSHKIHDTLKSKDNYFFSHEMNFIPFNYEERLNIISKKIKFNSFIFDGESASKINNRGNNKLLIVYLFKFKGYINEFRRQGNYFLESFHMIGGNIILIYLIFYMIGSFVNERIVLRNFQSFLNDKGENMIHKHINYEKSKFYISKSHIYTNFSNDINEQYSGNIKQKYYQNYLKNDTNNIDNSHNNIISNLKEKTLNMNLEKIKENENEISKKSDNIIIINNGTFMNDCKSNNNNNKFNLNLNNAIDKKSVNINNRIKLFDDIEGYTKTYTYNIRNKETYPTNKSLINNKEESNINFYIQPKKKKLVKYNLEKSEDNGTKQKLIDSSSLSFLSLVNKSNNLYMNNNSNYNKINKKKTPSYIEKELDSISPKSHTILKKNSSLSNEENSQKDNIKKVKNIISKKNHKKYNFREKFSHFGYIENIKKRRKSYQPRNTLREKHTINEKNNQTIYKKKTGLFQIPSDKHNLKRFSLLSRNSNIPNNLINNNHKVFSLYPCDNYSQQNISNNFLIDHYKRNSVIQQHFGKKNEKDISSPTSNTHSKNQRDGRSSVKKDYSNKHTNKFSRIIVNTRLTPIIIWDLLCMCRENKNNSINILNNFRHKLLSEEYLYILHLNMFIFKQKLGCKSNLEKNYLFEELYDDYY